MLTTTRAPRCPSRACPSLLLAGLFALCSAAQAQLPADLRLTQFASGFSEITGIHQPDDGSGRLFILEQSGGVRILRNGSTQAMPFLRLCSAAAAGCTVPPGGFSSGGERGLLGLAFHPQFASNRRLYLHYSDAQGDTAIASVLASTGNPDLADEVSLSRLLEVSQDFGNHNGGDIHFGPDGYLYIGLGDGGSSNDPCARAQTLDPVQLCNGASNDGQAGCPNNASCGPSTRGDSRALLGKMLRIDVDNATTAGANNLCAANPDGSASYAVPGDNPFAANDNTCGEVWLLGLRNPWRFSFDRATDDVLIGDVGQGSREEVNLIAGSASGSNFGWRCREGSIANPNGSIATSAPVCNAPPSFVDPVFDYDSNSGRCSITGGYRYRGPAVNLDGLYFYGDFCEGRVLIASESAGIWTQQTWTPNIGNIRTFGEGVAGELYVGTASTVYLVSGYRSVDTVHLDGFEDSVVP